MVRFNKSEVEYATHNLSLYYGHCPHGCRYCFVDNYRKRNWKWAIGPHRINKEAYELARHASTNGVECLVVSFTNDPLPRTKTTQAWHNKLRLLVRLLDILERRKIPTKVLTKNGGIWGIVDRTKPYKYIQIGVSITTNKLNWEVQKHWEPYSDWIVGRLGALLILNKKGFRTWISAEPILPQTDLFAFLNEISYVKPEEVWFGRGSYHQELINAFDWEWVVKIIGKMTIPGVHMKKELTTNNNLTKVIK